MPAPLRRLRPAALALAAGLSLVLTPAPDAVAADDFPPISDTERALTEVPGQPGVPAVILFRKGFMEIMNPLTDVSSRLDVELRIKILTEAGKSDYGTFEIVHSRWLRLKKLDGRTVQADGTVLPLAEDSIFEEKSSRSRRIFTTKTAFPGVEVGSILDLRYTVMWDSIYYLEPWLFHHELPTLHSEITYDKPGAVALTPWQTQADPTSPIQGETSRSAGGGVRLRVWADDLRGIPDEPSGFPRIDLSNRIMMVPKEVMLNSGDRYPLLESWKRTVEIFEEGYAKTRRKDGQVKKLAKQIIAAQPSPRERLRALHAFVRDEILTDPAYGLGTREDSAVDKVLESRRGDETEKALTLEVMLEAAGLDPRLVWAADEREGLIDPNVPSPAWFDRVLVRVDLDGEAIYLDPTDRGLAPGWLAPYFEGSPALVLERKNPEVVTLPEPSFERNHRRAELRLAIDEDGRVSGDGSLTLEGHHAWLRLRWKEDEEKTRDAWKEWLEDAFPGFSVADVVVEEAIDEERVRLGFALAQREEEVLGDEVSLALSRPLGPVEQAFALPPERRQTPVRLAFADRDEVVVHLAYPEGWEVNDAPADLDFRNFAGAVAASVENDAAAHTLVYRRRFDIEKRRFVGTAPYTALRDLYAAAEKHDAQHLVLLAP